MSKRVSMLMGMAVCGLVLAACSSGGEGTAPEDASFIEQVSD